MLANQKYWQINTNVKYICQDDWQDIHSFWLMNFLFHDLQFLEWRRISKNHFESDRHTNETFRMIPDWLKRMIGRFYSEFVKCYFSIVYMILFINILNYHLSHFVMGFVFFISLKNAFLYRFYLFLFQ